MPIGAFDYLHVGELGDATDRLIAALDADTSRPARRCGSMTQERLPLDAFPLPAYELAELDRYFLRQRAIFQRLSLSLRVLRYSRTLWPQSPP